MNKKTAIIIPTVPGNEELLSKCIESVIEYSKEYDYEIFIVKNDFISFSYAVNKAIKQILFDNSFDGIFIFNDDMIITNKNWLIDMYRVMSLDNADLVVSQNLLRNKGFPNEMCAMGFALFKPDVFKKIGLFDEQFKIGEWDDVDLSIRMKDAGLKWSCINYNPWIHLNKGSNAFKKCGEKRIEIYKNKQRLFNKYKNTKWENVFI